MYGNIGWQTAKGSGTSGYVQKSLAYIKNTNYKNSNYKEVLQKFKENPAPEKRKANNEIIEHELKHKIEVELYTYAEELKDKTLNEKEIETKINQRRKEWYDKMLKKDIEKISNKNDTHEMSMLKDKQMDKIKNALGVNNEYVSGEAFDIELQEEKRWERLKNKKEEERKIRKKEKEKMKLWKDNKEKEDEKDKKHDKSRDERRDSKKHHHHHYRDSTSRSRSRSRSRSN